jgi:hypothetical protein
MSLKKIRKSTNLNEWMKMIRDPGIIKPDVLCKYRVFNDLRGKNASVEAYHPTFSVTNLDLNANWMEKSGDTDQDYRNVNWCFHNLIMILAFTVRNA